MVWHYPLIYIHIGLILFVNAQTLHWQHFDDKTLTQSKKENKPILLHLAANWCHWCHVMEEKTYQNKQVIAYLNQHFIVCKEDHDLRPDLANKYRDYGWPATIIFSKDGKELYKHAGYMEASEFLKILQQAVQQKLSMQEKTTINPFNIQLNTNAPNNNLLYIKKDVMNSIDIQTGGFQSAQKSVDWDMYEYTYLHQQNDSLKQWLDITVPNSLGLLDTVWGGVYQYSTYADWQHPHYEKLLSVQSRYIKIYLWYYYISHQKKYLDAAISIYQYCKRFLYSNHYKAFYNAQDADLIKGKKATAYFALSDKERIKQGVPAVDTTMNTENNSRMIQSLLDLYAYTADSSYFYDAKNALNFILHHRYKNDFYTHATDTTIPLALTDQLQLYKALIKMYLFTQNELYLMQAKNLIHSIKEKFFSGTCFLSYIPLSNYLPPDCLVSENIEAARIFNMAFYLFNQEEYKHISQQILTFLTSDEVYNNIIVEPGILTLNEEIHTEPYTALYLNFQSDTSSLPLQLLQTPLSYYLYQRVTPKNVPEDKRELIANFSNQQQNLVLFCTHSFCSAPIYTASDLKEFILQQILKK